MDKFSGTQVPEKKKRNGSVENRQQYVREVEAVGVDEAYDSVEQMTPYRMDGYHSPVLCSQNFRLVQ